MSLAAAGHVLLLELMSEFSVFLCHHILSLLAGLVRHCTVELKAIVGRVLRGMVPIIIRRTEVTTVHVRDDAIIVIVEIGILEQLVAIVEKMAES